MFEKAARLKLRFPSSVGNLTIEDLWDLPLKSRGVSLDKLAIALNKEVKESGEESFVDKKSTASTALTLKFDIVKHVIDVKLAEAEAAKTRAEAKARNEKIVAIIAEKQDEGLRDLSVEELQKLVV